jgi:hypothetical protein
MLVYVRPSNEALLRRAFREHRTNVGALPLLLPCAFCEQEGHLATSSHPSEAARCALACSRR